MKKTSTTTDAETSLESMTISQLKQFIESHGRNSKGKKLHKEWVRIAQEIKESLHSKSMDAQFSNMSSTTRPTSHDNSRLVVCDVIHFEGNAYAVDTETSNVYDIESKTHVGKCVEGVLIRK